MDDDAALLEAMRTEGTARLRLLGDLCTIVASGLRDLDRAVAADEIDQAAAHIQAAAENLERG